MATTNRIRAEVNPAFFDNYTVYVCNAGKDTYRKIKDVQIGVVAAACIRRNENGESMLYLLTKNATRKTVSGQLNDADISFTALKETRHVPLKLLIARACRKEGCETLYGTSCLVPRFAKPAGKSALYIPEIGIYNEVTARNVQTADLFVHNRKWIHPDDDDHTNPRFEVDGIVIRRATKETPAEKVFIKHGKGKRAKAIRVLDFEKEMDAPRSAILRTIINDILLIFKETVSVSFIDAREKAVYPCGGKAPSAKAMLDALDKAIGARLRGCGLKVPAELEEIYTLYPDIERGDELEIRVIKTEEEYKKMGIRDEHINSLNVQQLTEETRDERLTASAGGSAPVFRKLLTELCIKRDVAEGRDILNRFVGDSYLETEPAIFISTYEADFRLQCPVYLKYGKDGDLSFGCLDETLDDPDLLPFAETIKNLRQPAKLIIHNGCVTELRDTLTTPLAADSFRKKVMDITGGKGTRGLRTRENRNALAGDLLNLHIYETDEGSFAYCGVVGASMDRTIKNASYFVKLVPLIGSEENYSWLFPYMAVTYMSGGEKYSKYPYPFKYLNEWLAVRG